MIFMVWIAQKSQQPTPHAATGRLDWIHSHHNPPDHWAYVVYQYHWAPTSGSHSHDGMSKILIKLKFTLEQSITIDQRCERLRRLDFSAHAEVKFDSHSCELNEISDFSTIFFFSFLLSHFRSIHSVAKRNWLSKLLLGCLRLRHIVSFFSGVNWANWKLTIKVFCFTHCVVCQESPERLHHSLIADDDDDGQKRFISITFHIHNSIRFEISLNVVSLCHFFCRNSSMIVIPILLWYLYCSSLWHKRVKNSLLFSSSPSSRSSSRWTEWKNYGKKLKLTLAIIAIIIVRSDRHHHRGKQNEN